MGKDDVRASLALELRRGALVLAVLSVLEKEQYGYSLKTDLAEKGVDVDEGTLYPLLRRLESQGLLDSRWDVDNGRPRRYYVLNKSGRALLKEMTVEWQTISRSLGRLLK
jgi:DNA-binding PadR family transcriptional regulator